MNTDHIRFLCGGRLANRKYSAPNCIVAKPTLNNEYFKDGKIYCWVGSQANEKYLVRLSEKNLEIDLRTDIAGYSCMYVDNKQILFATDKSNAVLVERDDLSKKTEPFSVPRSMLAVHLRSEKEILFELTAREGYSLFRWPTMEKIWEHKNEGLIVRGQLVEKNNLFVIHKCGVKKISLNDGDLIWEKRPDFWVNHPILQKKQPKDSLTIRSESTGIFADTLVLSLDPTVMVGIDINTGNIRWAIDMAGPQKLRVTQDGIGWFIRDENIYRLDIAKGELLPPLPIQFSPALEKPASAQVGAFDMSTTHLIAELSSRTSAGYTVGHIVGIRRDNGVCEWAVPIEGTVTKLYLLNNRIYATGTFMGADIAKPTSQTLIIEGEGGYIPD